MRDLYQSLRLEPDASPDRIAAAADSNPDVQEFTAILLDPDRRADYDRVRNVLRMIGELRRRLGLNKQGTWFAENYPDFAGVPAASSRPVGAPGRPPPVSAAPVFAARRHTAARPQKSLWRWVLPVAVAALGVTVIYLALRMF